MMPAGPDSGAGGATCSGMHAHTILLALAVAARLHAADAPTNNAALRVLTGQTAFTVEGKEDYLRDVTTFKVVFDPKGQYARTKSSTSRPGEEGTLALLDGALQTVNITADGHKSVRPARGNTNEIIDGTNFATGAATLGLKGTGPASLKYEDGKLKTIRVPSMQADKVLGGEGTVTFDEQGRIARIDWRAITKPGAVPPGHDAFLRTIYRYEAGDFAPGLPSGWLRQSFLDGKVIEFSETVLTRFVLSADFTEVKARISGPPVSGGREIPREPLF
jgi:hypothetical protein